MAIGYIVICSNIPKKKLTMIKTIRMIIYFILYQPKILYANAYASCTCLKSFYMQSSLQYVYLTSRLHIVEWLAVVVRTYIHNHL